MGDSIVAIGLIQTVAQHAAVSRQAVYLHFGDRNGLLLAFIQHLDDTLALGESLAAVFAAATGTELLEAAQYDDEALGVAWRDRMLFARPCSPRWFDRSQTEVNSPINGRSTTPPSSTRLPTSTLGENSPNTSAGPTTTRSRTSPNSSAGPAFGRPEGEPCGVRAGYVQGRLGWLGVLRALVGCVHAQWRVGGI